MNEAFVSKWLARADSVKGVVFDFGGVLVEAPGEDRALYPFLASRGISAAQYEEAFRRYRWLWDGGRIRFEDFCKLVFDFAHQTLRTEDLPTLWNLDAASWIEKPRTDTLALMRALKKHGKKMGILSNMAVEFYERLYSVRMADYRTLADAEVISGLVKLYKPERPIYDLAVERMNLPAQDLLFLDDLEENVLAARTYGWQSEVYPKFSQANEMDA